jgi:hypothetical protein
MLPVAVVITCCHINVIKFKFKLRLTYHYFPVYYKTLLKYKSIILQKSLFSESLVLYVDVTDVPTSVAAMLVIFTVERSGEPEWESVQEFDICT